MKNYDFLPDDFYEWPTADRAQFLRDNADEVKEETFHKPLAHEDRSELKDTLSDVSIDLSTQQEEYDKVKAHWREEVIKPLKETLGETVQKLKTGTEQVTGDVVYIRDYDRGKVVKMAEDGTELMVRPMRPGERQTTTHSNIRNINNTNS